MIYFKKNYLNFFNVFVDVDRGGDEEVYTISSDGTIIKTICGV